MKKAQGKAGKQVKSYEVIIVEEPVKKVEPYEVIIVEEPVKRITCDVTVKKEKRKPVKKNNS
jgi:hypothetical protein